MTPNWEDVARKLVDKICWEDQVTLPKSSEVRIAKALQSAYDKGREDERSLQPMTQEQLDEAFKLATEKFGWGKPKQRIELGCDSPSCFCTGRCKRTAEEQEAYEKREALMAHGLRKWGTDE